MSEQEPLAFGKQGTKRMMKIAAFDPGSVNHGWCVVTENLVIEAHGMLAEPMTMLTNGYVAQRNSYRRFLRKLKKLGCTIAVAERFQSRGLKGLSIELVTFMLAQIDMVYSRCKMIPASQWKNEYSRQGTDIKAMYVDLRPFTPHQIDACLIGVWAVCRVKGFELPHASRLKLLIANAKGAEVPVKKAKVPKLKSARKSRKARR